MDELTYCDCAGCGIMLLGDRWKAVWQERVEKGPANDLAPEPVWDRVLGRPYCKRCLDDHFARPRDGACRGGRITRHISMTEQSESSSSQANAIRTWEDSE